MLRARRGIQSASALILGGATDAAPTGSSEAGSFAGAGAGCKGRHADHCPAPGPTSGSAPAGQIRRYPMAHEVPDDLAEKAAIMREFGRRRAAGEPISDALRADQTRATNDGYATGPDPDQRIPDFALPDQNGAARTLGDLTGPNGLLLVFHRSADWCRYCRSQLAELEQSRSMLEKKRRPHRRRQLRFPGSVGVLRR